MLPNLQMTTGLIAATMRRFMRQRRGSAALEFAMIAPLFFCLLFAIIEVSLVFFAGQYLETATQETARLVLTGQAQTSNYDATAFKTQLCNRMTNLLSCSTGAYVDVQHYSSFASITLANPGYSQNLASSGFGYSPGNAGDIVVVRVYYDWQLFVTGYMFNIANRAGSKRLLIGTAVFRNEPYGS